MYGNNTCSTMYRREDSHTSSWRMMRQDGQYHAIFELIHSPHPGCNVRRMPFTFLAELQQRFTSLPSASSSDLSSAPAYALQGNFGSTIAQLMNTYNTAPPMDELTRAQTELAQVKDIMVQNVEQILSRGERIELLVDKTDNMASQATAFRRGARTVRRQMWWKNKRVLGLSVLVALVRRATPFRRWVLMLMCPYRSSYGSSQPSSAVPA